MKKFLLPLLSFALVGYTYTASAQRYVSEVFTSFNVTQNVNYHVNVSFLLSDFSNPSVFVPQLGTLSDLITDNEPIPLNWFTPNALLPDASQHTAIKVQALQMDIYTPPAADTETSRPVIVLLHTGNFLPPLFNGSITGSKSDSVIVNLSKQFAKRGYVAAAANYRGGWDPLSESADVRRGSLLRAVYRAIHDTQNAVRFMRASVAQGNPYGVDPSKIMLLGVGSGGYVALAYATLNDYDSEIAELPKFLDEDGIPYVVEATHGGLNGEPGLLQLPSPLQLAGISKDVSMTINLGGALADISWLDAGEPAMVSFHAVRDPFAPFDNGTVVVPTNQNNVVDVSGANVFIPVANELGNQDAFNELPDDAFSEVARGLYGETVAFILPGQPTITISEDAEGLFPVIRPINTTEGNIFTNEGSPWDWWDFATLQAVVTATNAQTGQNFNATLLHNQGLAGNVGMGPVKGLAYIDTIMGYSNPRIVAQMDLPTNIREVAPSIARGLKIFPNPGNGKVNFTSESLNVDMIKVYNFSGKLVKTITVNGLNAIVDVSDLADGVYIFQAHIGREVWHTKYVKN
ncbi:MAG: T9SS type A sorting domain-containing protein [Luteibaculaceae bacterium]